MLIADRVFREEGTGKFHIAGTFSRFKSSVFPAVLDTMHVYLALTDIAPGRHSCEVRFAYLDDEKELLSAKSEIRSDDKLRVVEMNLCFRRTVFPKPGKMEIAFYMDDQYVTRRRFAAVAIRRRGGKLGRPPGEPPAGLAGPPPESGPDEPE
jgi:hypothetical protein